jgi:hypothetical protein
LISGFVEFFVVLIHRFDVLGVDLHCHKFSCPNSSYFPRIDDFSSKFPPNSTNSSRRISQKSASQKKPAHRPAKAGHRLKPARSSAAPAAGRPLTPSSTAPGPAPHRPAPSSLLVPTATKQQATAPPDHRRCLPLAPPRLGPPASSCSHTHLAHRAAPPPPAQPRARRSPSPARGLQLSHAPPHARSFFPPLSRATASC